MSIERYRELKMSLVRLSPHMLTHTLTMRSFVHSSVTALDHTKRLCGSSTELVTVQSC